MRAAIFIDAGYFLKQVQEARVVPDYPKLVNYFLEPLRRSTALDLMRCYFYYCPPYMSSHPTEDEKRRRAQYERFVAEIEDIERWQFREGKLEKRREGDRDVYSQKRVDVLLSVDMVRHAAAGHVQHAVLVAGDSDFIPAVQAVKDSGVTVTLWCGNDRSPHKELMVEADDVQFLDFRRFPKLQKPAEPAPGDVTQQEIAATEVRAPGRTTSKKTATRAPRARKQDAQRAEAQPKREPVPRTLRAPAKPVVAAPPREAVQPEVPMPSESDMGSELAGDTAPKKKTRRGRRGGRGRNKKNGNGQSSSPQDSGPDTES